MFNHFSNSRHAEWVLRIGVFGSFLGHGVFALQQKAGWLKYFEAFGIGNETAGTLLILIGLLDVAVALVVLLFPIRLVLLWAALWGFWTALVRPIAGEPVWDFVERWANWAAPLALLMLYGVPNNWKDWMKVK